MSNSQFCVLTLFQVSEKTWVLTLKKWVFKKYYNFIKNWDASQFYIIFTKIHKEYNK